MAPYFYNGVIRKYIIMFGRMFNDIDIVRYNNGEAIQTIRVPIAYGPSEKFLSRLSGDPSLDKQVAIQLPRLGFELTSMNYAPNRTLNKMHKSTAVNTSDGGKLTSQYTPVPYDFNISLYGMFANQEDAVQVTEQIMPFFRPEWTMSLKLVDELNQYHDIATVLNNVSISDDYEGDYSSRRSLVYTWDFTVKGYLFGPIRNKGVIKRTVIDMSINDTADPIGTEVGPDKKIILTPGLLANGSPTANSTAGIPYYNVAANTNWDYAFENIDYFDGKNRHEH
jgi:hypothetical protein